MDEVHCPHIIRPCCLLAIVAELGLHSPLRCLVPQLHPQLTVNPAGSLLVDLITLAPQQYVHAAMAIPNARLANVPDPSLYAGLIAAARLLVVGQSIELEGAAGARRPP